MEFSEVERKGIEVEEEVFTLANILKAGIGTNCPQGGDTGHGGRTLIELENQSSTNWMLEVERESKPNKIFDNPKKIKLLLGGDHEARTMADALEYLAETLRSKIE